ncbi:MAG: hypothetical protein V4556_02605 [Bacteroidota bacterium]
MKIIIHKRHIPFLLLFLFSSFCSSAQVTTGIWKGELYNETTKRSLPLELVVTIEKNGFVKGYSYVTYDYQGREVRVLKRVKIAFHNNNVAFEDMDPLLDDTAYAALKKNKISYATAITGSGVALSMNGIWKTKKSDKKKGESGTLSLSKVDDFTEADVFKELQDQDRTKDLSFVRKKPKRDDVDIDLAAIDAPPVDVLPVAKNVEENKPDESMVAVKKAPAVTVKEASAAIKEEDKPVVAVVEKKEPAIPKPIEIKPAPPVEKPVEKKVEVVVAKPPPEEKKPQPVIAAKPVPEKKVPPVVAVVPKPVAPKPVTVAPKPVPVAPKPVAVASKPVPPPVAVKAPEPTVVKKELPKQVFAPPSGGVAADYMGRKTTTQQTVEFESDSLILTLYDNGEVDGDTVSVLMNGGVIFSKAGLTTRPNRKTIYINKDMPDTLSLLMYAENLGSIPPNTGLLVVWDADKVYELRFSADLKTNAAIIFRRKKN